MPKQILILGLLACFAIPAFAQEQPPMSQGEYLAHIGDCISCHTAPHGKPFAGGFRVNSPFGAIYGTNITPDPEYGIGTYSLEDFKRAVRQGIAKDGRHLYPAMPYPSFSKISDKDISALYSYFMHEVPGVHEQAPKTHLPFPFNQRWGLRFWNWLFSEGGTYKPQPEHDAAWNRGAYLVQSLGHCSACHTPRGIAYEERGTSETAPLFLSGETLDHWYAANLRGNKASGLGRWSEEEIAAFLGTGHAAGTVAFGNMRQVVENSGQYITPEDRRAMAHYLKSLEASSEQTSYDPTLAPKQFELPGAGIYANFCAGCHQVNGAGTFPRVPSLAGNSAVMSKDATSLTRIVLEGGVTPQVGNGPGQAKMPAFGKRLTDRQIADVVNFIRISWGNHAPPVDENQVSRLRRELAELPAATTPAELQPTPQ